jgi:hypothetical protein
MKTRSLIMMTLLAAGAFCRAADSTAEAIADAVIKASGGDNWPKVKKIHFTFNVEQDGKQLMSATHEWDLAKGTDTVTWAGKTATVKLNETPSDENAKAAFQRWTNDSYWLLAPLKLRDPGTSVTALTPLPPGAEDMDVIQLKFGAVGLTPDDVYNLYIDRATHLVRRWDYMPAPGKKVSGTWEGYQEFGGLKLATEHQFGDKRITFTDVKVESK